jgi:hypothetical protein
VTANIGRIPVALIAEDSHAGQARLFSRHVDLLNLLFHDFWIAVNLAHQLVQFLLLLPLLEHNWCVIRVDKHQEKRLDN